MPLRLKISCPRCRAPLVRRPGGRCPACGASVVEHVESVQTREARIERAVAVVGTALVLLVSLLTAGVSLLEGILAYAGAGAVVFFLGKRTFR